MAALEHADCRHSGASTPCCLYYSCILVMPAGRCLTSMNNACYNVSEMYVVVLLVQLNRHTEHQAHNDATAHKDQVIPIFEQHLQEVHGNTAPVAHHYRTAAAKQLEQLLCRCRHSATKQKASSQHTQATLWQQRHTGSWHCSTELADQSTATSTAGTDQSSADHGCSSSLLISPVHDVSKRLHAIRGWRRTASRTLEPAVAQWLFKPHNTINNKLPCLIVVLLAGVRLLQPALAILPRARPTAAGNTKSMCCCATVVCTRRHVAEKITHGALTPGGVTGLRK